VSSVLWESRTRTAVGFYRATLCVSAVFAVAWSVTLVYCIQTAEDIVKLLSRPGGTIILVFGFQPSMQREPLQ